MRPLKAWLCRGGGGWLGLVLVAALSMAQLQAAETQVARAPAQSSYAAEATGEAARLSRMQGRAESAVVDWVLANSGPLAGDTHAGAYRIAYTITPAEGWWEMAGGGKLAWHEPPAGAVHLRVFVLDASDGRLSNAVILAATLIDSQGNQQAAPVAFGWYPLINAYGANVPLSADGSYRLQVSVVAPAMGSAIPPGDDTPAPSEIQARITTVEFPAVTIEQNQVMLQPPATQMGFTAEAKLLKPGNDALSAALTALWQQSATGAEKPSGDYFVAYGLGDATASNALSVLRRKGKLDFGRRENAPLQVLVRDSRTGRPLPMLTPHVRLTAADGHALDGGELLPLRRPWLNVYGRSLRLARKGSYTMLVSFDAPGFRRWGRQSERFAQPAEVEFEDLSLRPLVSPENAKPESRTP